jgi:uncharacterized membrane protein YesL
MQLIDFLTEHAGWLLVISLLTAILTLALVPVLITNIPADYFSSEQRLHINTRHPLLNYVIKAAKNLLGAVLLLVGFVLLFLPGQGLILIFVGLLIMNYPGKYRLECWLVRRRGVLTTMNALRARHGKAPLLLP